jgi:hypothetical protein
MINFLQQEFMIKSSREKAKCSDEMICLLIALIDELINEDEDLF